MTRKREVIASEDISDLPPPSHRHPMSGEPIWDQHAVRALLSKLRAEGVQAGDERGALRAFTDFAAERRAELGVLSPEMDAIDARARAALASAPVAGEAQPVCWIEKDVLESVRDEGSDAWVYWRPADHVAEHDEMPLYAAPQASEPDFADAYEGAREDLAIWKRRALEAERDLRAERETSSRLVAALNAESGPMHMGEPAPQASTVAGEAGAAIIRFNPFPGLGMNPAPNGLYVRYEDHAATLSSLAAPQASEAVRDAALEEAAVIVETAPDYLQDSSFNGAARAIRALKTQADKDGGK